MVTHTKNNSLPPNKIIICALHIIINNNNNNTLLNKISQDIVCPEAVKLDDLDPAAVTSNYESAKSRASAAESGSAEAAMALIEVEVNKAMGGALGLNLA